MFYGNFLLVSFWFHKINLWMYKSFVTNCITSMNLHTNLWIYKVWFSCPCSGNTGHIKNVPSLWKCNSITMRSIKLFLLYSVDEYSNPCLHFQCPHSSHGIAKRINSWSRSYNRTKQISYHHKNFKLNPVFKDLKITNHSSQSWTLFPGDFWPPQS